MADNLVPKICQAICEKLKFNIFAKKIWQMVGFFFLKKKMTRRHFELNAMTC